MRWTRATAFATALAVTLAAGGAAGATPDLRIDASGTDGAGAVMRLACDLDFASIPSNLFIGTCRLTLGGDSIVLVGNDVDRQRLPTLVLNGTVTIRGLVGSATGRFAPLVEDGIEGFPVLLEIDPLARAWTLRTSTSTGNTTLTTGVLSGGRIFFALR